MAQISGDTTAYPHEQVRAFCEGLLCAAGVRGDDAHVIADSLVEANLRGVDTHGVARLPHYLERLRRDSINAQPDITFDQLAPSVGIAHGDDGPGQLVMQRATSEAVGLARETGAGWVTVDHSSHCGMLAYYGLQIAEAGMVGFVFTHVESLVIPYASREPFCGTNPICIAVPGGATGGTPGGLCLDMATSIVPWNTVKNAAIAGVSLSPDWAVDAAGNPTTDPEEAAAVHAFGGYKGSGLGLMIDVLCTLLGGAPSGPDLNPMYGDMDQVRLLGGLVGAIDIARFGDVDAGRDRIIELTRRWNALPPVDPDDPVLYPGQPELLRREERLRDGIPIEAQTVEAFNELATQQGLGPFAASD